MFSKLSETSNILKMLDELIKEMFRHQEKKMIFFFFLRFENNIKDRITFNNVLLTLLEEHLFKL